MAWYDTGTVQVTGSSPTVTGSVTKWRAAQLEASLAALTARVDALEAA